VERRLAVLARGNTQALIRHHRRPGAWLIVLALVSLASSADAKPKRRDAKVAFDRGVAAYQKGNFEAASEALGKSFDLERDVDTLFAWAQSERKLEHCDKASDLYEKLLTFNLPAANKSAVELKLDECRKIIGQQKPKAEPAPGEPVPVSGPGDPKPPSVQEPPLRSADGVIPPEPPPQPGDPQPTVRVWYKDPVALGLVGGGIVATGVGTAFLISARALSNDAKAGTKAGKTYDEVQDLNDKATSRGTIGLITTAAGGALLVGGLVWIATHRGSTEQRVAGWLSPDGGGGLAVAGVF
jgi:tetratricopeptide (TPR) repeat protein